MDYLKDNKDILITGVLSVGIGFAGNKLFKNGVFGTKNGKHLLSSFAIVSVSGLIANEIKKKYPNI